MYSSTLRVGLDEKHTLQINSRDTYPKLNKNLFLFHNLKIFHITKKKTLESRKIYLLSEVLLKNFTKKKNERDCNKQFF